MSDMVNVLNQETGQRGRIRRRLFESTIFNNGILVEVDEDQKPYVTGMFRARNVADEADEIDETPDLEIPDEDEDE